MRARTSPMPSSVLSACTRSISLVWTNSSASGRERAEGRGQESNRDGHRREKSFN